MLRGFEKKLIIHQALIESSRSKGVTRSDMDQIAFDI